MSDIRTKEILSQLIEDLSLAITKAKAQLEYVDEDPWVVEMFEKYGPDDNSDAELEFNGLRLWD